MGNLIGNDNDGKYYQSTSFGGPKKARSEGGHRLFSFVRASQAPKFVISAFAGMVGCCKSGFDATFNAATCIQAVDRNNGCEQRFCL